MVLRGWHSTGNETADARARVAAPALTELLLVVMCLGGSTPAARAHAVAVAVHPTSTADAAPNPWCASADGPSPSATAVASVASSSAGCIRANPPAIHARSDPPSLDVCATTCVCERRLSARARCGRGRYLLDAPARTPRVRSKDEHALVLFIQAQVNVYKMFCRSERQILKLFLNVCLLRGRRVGRQMF